MQSEAIADDRDDARSRSARRCSWSRTIRAMRRVLRDLARSRGFKVLVADARQPRRCGWRAQYRPSAISLDIFLPDMLGWTVLSQLKQDSTTRHIPVQIVTVDEERHHSLERGAFAYLAKPRDHRSRSASARTHQRVHAAAQASACWSSRTTPASA